MSTVKSPLPDDAKKVTGAALQGALVDLVDLSLKGKQAHWNLMGRNFRSLHFQLDEIVSLSRAHTDTVAERSVALGLNPDGRAKTVADSAHGPAVDGGYLQDDKVIAVFTDLLAQAIGRFRERVQLTGEPDPMTQDLLIQITRDLEKQHWMIEVQRQ